VDNREDIPCVEFATQDDLLKHDDVKRWSDEDTFSHFAMSHNHLMAILDDGYTWWLVGYLTLATKGLIDLPKWEGGKYKAKLADGSLVDLTSSEVVSSCGDCLTLKDGTTATNLKY